ncbi:branched-chain amino acid ABC transporter permease [Microbacterium schleiferi]|uniref:ABC transporter permease subunit n=1 Tax=Microbacterium schleiferi TaxID=69362 RepID=UPI0035C7EE8D
MALTLVGLLALPTAAHAADDDPYRISGNVQLEGEPLEGVELTVDGPGGEQTVETDADGQWAVGVPERNADYTVTLNEDTLPEGIAVIDETGEDTSPNVREVTVGPGGRVTTNFFIGEGERNTTGFVDQLVERLVNGVNFGLMLALAAIGLSLVYGTTGISNFAHGEMVTFGALIALLFAVGLSLPLLVAVPLAVIVSGAFGYAMDAGLWRPLRRRGLGVVQLMIVSIGLSLALRYIFQMFVGGGTLQLPNPLSGVIPLPGSIVLTWMDLVSMLISVVVIIIFALWLTRSRIGRATRAVSDNPSLAAASGIDVDGIVRIVWILAAALAGLSGVLWAYFRPGAAARARGRRGAGARGGRISCIRRRR